MRKELQSISTAIAKHFIFGIELGIGFAIGSQAWEAA